MIATECSYPKIKGDNPEWSPDGNWVAYDTVWVEHPNRSQIYIMNLLNNKEYQITNIDGGANEPSWSPDGFSIFYRGNGVGIQSLDISCILNDEECNLDPIYVSEYLVSPDLSPDGQYLVGMRYSLEENKTYDLLVINTEEPEQSIDITPKNTSGCQNPTWSPDGKQILAYCVTDTLHDIFIIDWETLEAVNITQSPGVTETEPEWSPDGKSIAFLSDTGEGLGNCLVPECSVISRGLFVMDMDGTNISRLSYRDDEHILWLSWMP